MLVRCEDVATLHRLVARAQHVVAGAGHEDGPPLDGFGDGPDDGDLGIEVAAVALVDTHPDPPVDDVRLGHRHADLGRAPQDHRVDLGPLELLEHGPDGPSGERCGLDQQGRGATEDGVVPQLVASRSMTS